MPSSYDIQLAIAAIIKTAAPTAVVIPRNILGELDRGNFAMLQSSDDSNKVHGWVVTLIAQPLVNEIHFEYDPRFWVWQILEYETGNDMSF